MRHILVAVDDSDASARVTDLVNGFFDALDVTITAMNVGSAPLPSPYAVDPGGVFAWRYSPSSPLWIGDEHAEAIVSEEAEGVVASSGVHATRRVVELGGDVADTIRRDAEELDMDIIVGSSHKTLFERLVSSSVSSDLAKAPPTPVLVVH